MSNFNLLKIISVDKITAESVSLSFEVPKQLKNNYNFIPGQYLTLELEINNLKVRRSYSICSGPDEILKVGIKNSCSLPTLRLVYNVAEEILP